MVSGIAEFCAKCGNHFPDGQVCKTCQVAQTRNWHCYIGAYESVYAVDMVADTAEQAAELAATKHKLAGDWTVIQGEPVTVTIAEVQAFRAERQRG